MHSLKQIASFVKPVAIIHSKKKIFFFEGSLAYLTAATHGLTQECDEIQETFGLDPDTVSEMLHLKVFLDNDNVGRASVVLWNEVVFPLIYFKVT